MARYRVGIDIGGTFTDFVIYRPATGEIETFKLLSTPYDPALAVLDGLRWVFGDPVALDPGPDSAPDPLSLRGASFATKQSPASSEGSASHKPLAMT